MILLGWLSFAVAAETRYVQASTLNLRAGPASSSAVTGRLTIGSPVTVVASGAAPFVRVRTGNGKEGWVDGTFLGPSALSAAEASARSSAATTPADRLTWAQRAAAIDADDVTLRALEAAYRAAGDAAAADRVASERRWPGSIRLAAAAGRIEIEWPSDGAGPSTAAGDVPVPLSDLRRLTGLDPAARWWMLPSRGPAVQVSVASAAYTVWNECGGTSGLVLRFGPAPDGATPIAFTAGAPPASWSATPLPPTVPEATAKAAADALAATRGWTAPVVSTVALPDGWFVRVSHEGPSDPDDGDLRVFTVVDLAVGAAAAVVHEEELRSYGEPDRPTVARDVDGDGTAEIVWLTGCYSAVSDRAGARRAQSEDRCCGC
ncbi:MAG: SH3 domain-containing protein [Myxococcota bacterium]